MVQQTRFQHISPQQLNEICGVALSPSEYRSCLDRGQSIEPSVGELWTDRDIEAGLYILVSGKVRLLTTDDEPIEVLRAGQYFGEYNLCPDLDCRLYIARAGIIVDPAIGQLTLTYAEFKQGWTNYALILQPIFFGYRSLFFSLNSRM